MTFRTDVAIDRVADLRRLKHLLEGRSVGGSASQETAT
jgi:hypothetical protein